MGGVSPGMYSPSSRGVSVTTPVPSSVSYKEISYIDEEPPQHEADEKNGSKRGGINKGDEDDSKQIYKTRI